MHRLWEALLPIVAKFVEDKLKDSTNFYSNLDVEGIPEDKIVVIEIRYMSRAKHENRAE